MVAEKAFDCLKAPIMRVTTPDTQIPFSPAIEKQLYPDAAKTIAAVKKAGYRSATSTESGLARPSDLWSLDRVRIELGDGSPELESKLTAAGA